MRHRELAEILLDFSYLERGPDEEPFVLASGRTSRHYFDCERTISRAKAMPLIGEAFSSYLLPDITCVGGPTRGADPIADAIAYYNILRDRELNVFSVRKNRKEHGITGWVEGSAKPGERVAFVDDVVTSGKSVIEALEHCQEAEIKVDQVLVLVDREEGGMDRIRAAVPGVEVIALFTYQDIMDIKNERARQSVSGCARELAGAI